MGIPNKSPRFFSILSVFLVVVMLFLVLLCAPFFLGEVEGEEEDAVGSPGMPPETVVVERLSNRWFVVDIRVCGKKERFLWRKWGGFSILTWIPTKDEKRP